MNRNCLRNIVACVLFATCGLFSDIALADMVFIANLDGAQANGGMGTGSSATGLATLMLNNTMDELSMEISFEGLITDDITAFHIHVGEAGVNGPVAFGLVAPNHDADGDFMDLGTGFVSQWDANDTGLTLGSQLDNLLNAGLYFNAHTSAFPGGEIRGQIRQIPEPSLVGLVGAAVTALFARRRQR